MQVHSRGNGACIDKINWDGVKANYGDLRQEELPNRANAVVHA